MKLSKPVASAPKYPTSCDSDHLLIANVKNHPSSDTFSILRTKVLAKMDANQWNVLAITSPRANAGKSFTASNLAISIAMEENHSALLVDCDFRRPSIQHYFGFALPQGLSDFFYGNTPLSDLIIRSSVKRLSVLPAGKQANESLKLLSGSRMTNLIGELKNRYTDRIVVVDLPPLLDTADALAFLPNADACLLVIAEGESTVDDIKQSLQLIDKNKLLGSILNKSTENVAPVYY